MTQLQKTKPIWYVVSILLIVSVSTTIGFGIGYEKTESKNKELLQLCTEKYIKLKEQQYQTQQNQEQPVPPPETPEIPEIPEEDINNVFIIKAYNKLTDTYYFKTFTFGIKNTSSPLDDNTSNEQNIMTMISKCDPSVNSCTVDHEIIVDSLGQLLIQEKGQILQPDQNYISVDKTLFENIPSDNLQQHFNSWGIPDISFNAIWIGQEIKNTINGIMMQKTMTTQHIGFQCPNIVIISNDNTKQLKEQIQYLKGKYEIYNQMFSDVEIYGILINQNITLVKNNSKVDIGSMNGIIVDSIVMNFNNLTTDVEQLLSEGTAVRVKNILNFCVGVKINEQITYLRQGIEVNKITVGNELFDQQEELLTTEEQIEALNYIRYTDYGCLVQNIQSNFVGIITSEISDVQAYIPLWLQGEFITKPNQFIFDNVIGMESQMIIDDTDDQILKDVCQNITDSP